MTNRRTGETNKHRRKNYLSRYRKLIKMQKTHYSKWLDVTKELKEIQPHLEKSKHGKSM
jgi:hypothetical protein